MWGTYGFCHTPLKSTLPDGSRGVGPAGGVKSRCAATGWPNTLASASAASRLTARRLFTDPTPFYLCGFGGGGLSPPDDPANTLRPSGRVTIRALQALDPSL